ncbi:MAG: hypothetical protein ACE367_07305 [Acidimicrobiales bacterium]
MSDDPHEEPTRDDDHERERERERDEQTIDPAPVDIDADDIATVLPHRDHPDQEPPGAAGAPVPPG